MEVRDYLCWVGVNMFNFLDCDQSCRTVRAILVKIKSTVYQNIKN